MSKVQNFHQTRLKAVRTFVPRQFSEKGENYDDFKRLTARARHVDWDDLDDQRDVHIYRIHEVYVSWVCETGRLFGYLAGVLQ